MKKHKHNFRNDNMERICQIFGNNTRKTMKKELFIQLMEQQKQMSDLKKALDRLDYRQREILKQIKEEMETTQTKGTINVFLMKSELEYRGGVFSEEYKSPDNLFEYLNKNKVKESL